LHPVQIPSLFCLTIISGFVRIFLHCNIILLCGYFSSSSCRLWSSSLWTKAGKILLFPVPTKTDLYTTCGNVDFFVLTFFCLPNLHDLAILHIRKTNQCYWRWGGQGACNYQYKSRDTHDSFKYLGKLPRFLLFETALRQPSHPNSKTKQF
jgi:hypothetical protein